MEDTKKKYPNSKNNKQCIGPCYEQGTWIVHPITLEYITDKHNPFCPVHEYEHKDPKTGQITKLNIDPCYVPTSSNAKENLVLPQMDLDPDHFLKIYYELYSLDDALEFIKNTKNLSYFTFLRIMECVWKVYIKDISFIDERITEFYILIIKKEWIKNIYSYVKNYIDVKDDKIFINKNNNKGFKIEKINFFVEKFVTKNNIDIFLSDFLNTYKNKETVDYNMLIKREFIKYIVDQLESYK